MATSTNPGQRLTGSPGVNGAASAGRRRTLRTALLVAGVALATALAAVVMGQTPAELGRSFQELWKPPVAVTSWDVLGLASAELADGSVRPTLIIPPAVASLAGTTVRLTGYMFPMDAEPYTDRFLLVELPVDCPFCFANWSQPTRMAEIWADEPIRFIERQVTLQGRLELIDDDPGGIVYRLLEARPTG